MGAHHLTNHGLDRPSLLDKAKRQIVQQSRMCRQLALRAEVVHRLYKTASENVMPKTIRHHASRQGISGVGDCLGQFQPPTRCGSEGGPIGIQRSQEAVRDGFACKHPVASPFKDGAVDGIAIRHPCKVGYLVKAGLYLLDLRDQGGYGIQGGVKETLPQGSVEESDLSGFGLPGSPCADGLLDDIGGRST